jgi:hypothetical protein
MLQAFHLDVAKIDLDVAYDSYTRMCLSVCFKCFVCFQSYVASVSIGYFKSTSRGAHVVIALVAGAVVCCRRLLLLLGRRRGSPCGRLRPIGASTACIRKQGKAGALLSVTALLRRREQLSDASCGWTARHPGASPFVYSSFFVFMQDLVSLHKTKFLVVFFFFSSLLMFVVALVKYHM